MTKEDLIIEFHKKINEIEQDYFKDRHNELQKSKDILTDYSLKKTGKIDYDFANGLGWETLSMPFHHEFYIKGYKCKIEHLTFKIFD